MGAVTALVHSNAFQCLSTADNPSVQPTLVQRLSLLIIFPSQATAIPNHRRSVYPFSCPFSCSLLAEYLRNVSTRYTQARHIFPFVEALRTADPTTQRTRTRRYMQLYAVFTPLAHRNACCLQDCSILSRLSQAHIRVHTGHWASRLLR